MKSIFSLVKILAALIALINTIGLLITVVWLAWIGEWGAIGLGLLCMFTLGILIGKPFNPAKLLPIYKSSLQTRSRIKHCFFVVSYILIMTAYCCFTLLLFSKKYIPGIIVPMLLWSYFTASPAGLAIETAVKKHGAYIILPSLGTQASYLIVILMVLYSHIGIFSAFCIIFLGTSLGFILLLTSPVNRPIEDYMTD